MKAEPEFFDFLNSQSLHYQNPRNLESNAHHLLRDLFLEIIARKKAIEPQIVSQFTNELKKAVDLCELRMEKDQLKLLFTQKAKFKNSKWRLHFLTAAKFLSHSDLTRLKQCEGNNCPIVFWDSSKNKARRWCDMNHCGMLDKSRRYYDRHRRVGLKKSKAI